MVDKTRPIPDSPAAMAGRGPVPDSPAAMAGRGPVPDSPAAMAGRGPVPDSPAAMAGRGPVPDSPAAMAGRSSQTQTRLAVVRDSTTYGQHNSGDGGGGRQLVGGSSGPAFHNGDIPVGSKTSALTNGNQPAGDKVALGGNPSVSTGYAGNLQLILAGQFIGAGVIEKVGDHHLPESTSTLQGKGTGEPVQPSSQKVQDIIVASTARNTGKFKVFSDSLTPTPVPKDIISVKGTTTGNAKTTNNNGTEEKVNSGKDSLKYAVTETEILRSEEGSSSSASKSPVAQADSEQTQSQSGGSYSNGTSHSNTQSHQQASIPVRTEAPQTPIAQSGQPSVSVANIGPQVGSTLPTIQPTSINLGQNNQPFAQVASAPAGSQSAIGSGVGQNTLAQVAGASTSSAGNISATQIQGRMGPVSVDLSGAIAALTGDKVMKHKDNTRVEKFEEKYSIEDVLREQEEERKRREEERRRERNREEAERKQAMEEVLRRQRKAQEERQKRVSYV